LVTIADSSTAEIRTLDKEIIDRFKVGKCELSAADQLSCPLWALSESD